MFYEIQLGHHINLKDVTYFYLSDSEMYRNCIIIYFRGMKDFKCFRYKDYYSCQQVFERLVVKVNALNNPAHITAIMD